MWESAVTHCCPARRDISRHFASWYHRPAWNSYPTTSGHDRYRCFSRKHVCLKHLEEMFDHFSRMETKFSDKDQLEIFHTCDTYTYMVLFSRYVSIILLFDEREREGGKGTNLYWRCWIRITRTVCGIEMRTSNVSQPDYYFACVRCVWWKESFMTWLRNEAIDSNRSFLLRGSSFINISYSVDASSYPIPSCDFNTSIYKRERKKKRKEEKLSTLSIIRPSLFDFLMSSRTRHSNFILQFTVFNPIKSTPIFL